MFYYRKLSHVFHAQFDQSIATVLHRSVRFYFIFYRLSDTTRLFSVTSRRFGRKKKHGICLQSWILSRLWWTTVTTGTAVVPVIPNSMEAAPSRNVPLLLLERVLDFTYVSRKRVETPVLAPARVLMCCVVSCI